MHNGRAYILAQTLWVEQGGEQKERRQRGPWEAKAEGPPEWEGGCSSGSAGVQAAAGKPKASEPRRWGAVSQLGHSVAV